MCEPATIAMVVTAASAVVGGYSAIRSGQAQQASAEFQAAQSRENAKQVDNDIKVAQEQAAIERRRLGAQARADKGDLVAKYSAMGLDPGFGSPADLIGDVKSAYDIDRSILNANEISQLQRFDMEKSNLLSQASLYEAEGKEAMRAGYLGATKSLLDAAGSVAGKWRPSAATTGKSLSASTVKKSYVPKYTPPPYKSGLRVWSG